MLIFILIVICLIAKYRFNRNRASRLKMSMSSLRFRKPTTEDFIFDGIILFLAFSWFIGHSGILSFAFLVWGLYSLYSDMKRNNTK